MNKGSRDLMRGGQAAVLGTLPTALVYFSVYEATREVLQRILPDQPARVHLSSAAAGALASSVFRVPGDSVRHQVTNPFDPCPSDLNPVVRSPLHKRTQKLNA